MKIKEINAMKRKHNDLFKEGQDLMARIEAIAPVMMSLRQQIEDAEGDDYDPIPVIFGGGFWIDVDGEEAERRNG